MTFRIVLKYPLGETSFVKLKSFNHHVEERCARYTCFCGKFRELIAILALDSPAQWDGIFH